jgi:hypothetical protein
MNVPIIDKETNTELKLTSHKENQSDGEMASASIKRNTIDELTNAVERETVVIMAGKKRKTRDDKNCLL